jgi:hypothetical protein
MTHNLNFLIVKIRKRHGKISKNIIVNILAVVHKCIFTADHLPVLLGIQWKFLI